MGAFFGRLIRAFSAFFRWLFGSPTKPAPESNVSDPPHVAALRVRPVFVDIDVGEFATRHDLEKLGRERGLQNLPPSEASFPDVIESQIVREVETRMKDACAEYQRAAESYGLAVQLAAIEAHRMKASIAAQNAILNLEGEWQACKGSLHECCEKANRSQRDFKEFREINGLRRDVRSENRIKQFAVVAVLIALETILNGSFLARGLEGGVVQGLFLALAFAVVNTGSAFMFGWASRYIWHRKIYLRLAGALMIIAWVVLFSAGLNLAIAHYRDALGGPDPENAASIALIQLRRHPLMIGDLLSLLLLAVGVVFSAIGFYDGARMDDPYPGYGRIARRREESSRDFNEQSQETYNSIARLQGEKVKQIVDDINYANRLREILAADRTNVRNVCENLSRHLDQLEASAGSAIEVYRDANRRSRTTPPPGYFSATPLFTRPASFNLPGTSEIEIPPPLNGDGPSEILEKFKEIVESFPKLDGSE